MGILLPGLPGLGDAINPVINPADSISSEGLKAQRDYAKALMTGNVVKGTGPQFPVVQHWSQGISNMVNALMGGGELYQANQRDRTAAKQDAANTFTATPTVPNRSFNEGPSSEGHEMSDGSPESKAIASIESKGSGDYSAVGPPTRTGDRAYGKYQVMGANVPAWTEEVLGRKMTPGEFLKDPKAQDAVFATKFAQGGDNPTDRASVWFTGKPYAQGANRSDGYITGAQYVDKFNKALGFAGSDKGEQSPAVQAMSSALRNEPTQFAENTEVAAARGVPGIPNPKPEPNSSGIFVDPNLVQKRPRLSEQQMRGIMSSFTLSEQAKLGFLQQYQQQDQPIDVPYPGGVVRIDPNNPRRQQFVPELQKGTEKIGDIETQRPFTVTPNPNGPGLIQTPTTLVPSVNAGPRSDAAPTTAPIAPAGSPVAPAAVPGPAVAETAPAAATAPIKVASLDPTAGVATAAANATGTTPATVPPTTPPVVAQTNPLARMAAGPPPPGISQEIWDRYTQKKAYDNQTALDQEAGKAKIEVEKDAQTKAADAAIKKYDIMSTQAQAARKQMPNLDLALAMMSDPNFNAGLLAAPKDVWNRIRVAAGGDRLANASNEAFDKVMAGTILDNMKTALGGLGQVRLAEISLLTKANANRNNTDASNRAVIEVSRRAVQTVDHLDDIGQQYVSGDEVRDPISGRVLLKANIKDGEILPRHGLDVGYDKLARKFVLEHPTFTADQIKNYETIFNTGLDPSAASKTTVTGKTSEQAPKEPAIGEVKEFDDGKGGKVQGVWDGKVWGPKK